MEVEGTSITKFLRKENSNTSREQWGRVCSRLWYNVDFRLKGGMLGLEQGDHTMEVIQET